MIDFFASLIAYLFFVLIGYAASALIAWSFSVNEWELWLRTCFAVWCLFFGFRAVTAKG